MRALRTGISTAEDAEDAENDIKKRSLSPRPQRPPRWRVFSCPRLALALARKPWTLPEGAATEKSPLALSPDVLKKGESLYKSIARGVHGQKGLGDGPNVDKKDRKIVRRT